ncbi:hypothetical protein SAMN05216302_101458 [Nitrosomonas aestuarii]|uniref:HIRAN domain-containing protein n=1 Tax=Nitrosomonas aestuarii TaxID=52441 RepID=A0A1I4C3V6_9PROT|nr:hypothetical protein [Nitrosomonas aestuarii]SFK75067.1 hypothetical protein SAMN05216302_101458 [Nitrosomonas aestuarii]
MKNFVITFIAFFSALILMVTTSTANAILYTIAIVGFLLTLKWLFASHPVHSTANSKSAQIPKPSKEATVSTKNHYTLPGELYEWPQLNEYEFEVVGESYYQPAISRIHEEWVANHESVAIPPLDAHLIPDDNNPYDDKAVRIDINQYTVGHLSRDDARSFRRRLGAKKMTGQITKCKAIITGGHDLANGQQASFGVSLDIKPFG